MRLFTHASRFNQRLTIILALTVLLLGGLALLAQSARAQYPVQVASAPPPPVKQTSDVPHGADQL